MAKCPDLDYGELSFTMGSTHWWQGSIIIIITGGLGPPNGGSKTAAWQTARVTLCVRVLGTDPPPVPSPPQATRPAFVLQHKKKLREVKRSLYWYSFIMIHNKKLGLAVSLGNLKLGCTTCYKSRLRFTANWNTLWRGVNVAKSMFSSL